MGTAKDGRKRRELRKYTPEERDSTGSVTLRVYGGWGLDDLVLQVAGGRRLWITTDSQSSVIKAFDDGGELYEQFSYSDYGEPSRATSIDGTFAPGGESEFGMTQLFTGAWYDEEIGLYWLRTRFMDPDLGRFLARDPAGIWADAGSMGNGYTYAGNNPGTFIDPLGLKFFDGPMVGGGPRGFDDGVDPWGRWEPCFQGSTGTGERGQTSPTSYGSEDEEWAADAARLARAMTPAQVARPKPTPKATAPPVMEPFYEARAELAEIPAGAFADLGDLQGKDAVGLDVEQGAAHANAIQQGITDGKDLGEEAVDVAAQSIVDRGAGMVTHAMARLAGALRFRAATMLAGQSGDVAARGGLEGPLPLIHAGRQGKHIPGHNNAFLGRHTGTGQQIGDVAVGLPGSRERVNFGEVIGNYVDGATGTSVSTTNGIIHYSSDGIHIVPARP